MTSTTHVYDVVVVGGGVVGCAVARELSLRQLSVAIIEARNDVGAAMGGGAVAALLRAFGM